MKRSSLNRFRRASGAKKAGILVTVFLFLLVIVWVVGIMLAPDYTGKTTPAGVAVNTTHYLQLDDRYHVFISVWVPDDLQRDMKIPALMQSSRYLTMIEAGPLMKLAQTYLGAEDENYTTARKATANGYAYVFVQMPGTVGSTGPRIGEYMPNEIDAIALAVDWITSQSWSNKKVGAFGTSYAATTSDLAAATMRPEVKAVVPTAPDFDAYSQVIRPGGVVSEKMARIWGAFVHGMDIDDICKVSAADRENQTLPFWECILTKLFVTGTQRPGKDNMELFEQATREHAKNADVFTLINDLEYRDQILRETSDNLYIAKAPPFSMNDTAYYQYRERAEKSQVNNYTIISWMDGGVAEGSLQKYVTFDTPLKITIHPRAHGARHYVDPFSVTRELTAKEKADDWNDQIAFFDHYLKTASDSAPQRKQIRYFTYGVNRWNQTTVWPPEGIQNETWYFRPDQELAPVIPASNTGSDRYAVDFSASTGEFNRWTAQMGRKVVYGDRREEDRKLLTYTSQPLDRNVEVTGSPTVNLYVSSTHTDGAFYCYLEDVGPDGRVTMLTEGILRAIHRKRADPASAPFVPLGVYHSLSKDDAMPMVPGEITEVAITLFPISSVFRKGHRIRVAIAGHDNALEDRYPKKGMPVLTFERNGRHASNIELPIMRRK